MIWLMLVASLATLGAWLAAIIYLSEPLAARIEWVVAKWWQGSDSWEAANYVAAGIIAIVAGLIAMTAWGLVA